MERWRKLRWEEGYQAAKLTRQDSALQRCTTPAADPGTQGSSLKTHSEPHTQTYTHHVHTCFICVYIFVFCISCDSKHWLSCYCIVCWWVAIIQKVSSRLSKQLSCIRKPECKKKEKKTFIHQSEKKRQKQYNNFYSKHVVRTFFYQDKDDMWYD